MKRALLWLVVFLPACAPAPAPDSAMTSGLGSGVGVAQRRLSIADKAPDFLLQPPELVQSRFNQYWALGIRTLRVDLVWAAQEPDFDGQLRPSPYVAYLHQAAAMGFSFKATVGAASAPPGWFFQQHPDAAMQGEHCEPDDDSPQDCAISSNIISYWYPDLHAVLEQKDDALFASLANEGLLGALSYVIVPLGPASEPIYPAAWTTAHPDGGERYWFYGPAARADFVAKMQSQYKSIEQANAAWHTAFASWSALRMPRVGEGAPPFWRDVLGWYRQTKNDFITWQVHHYQQLLARYYPSGNAPAIMLLAPGTNLTDADFDYAVSASGRSAQTMLMTDSDFVVGLARNVGATLQATGLPELSELAYLQRLAGPTPMWGENTGGVVDPATCAAETIAAGLVGFDFINSQAIFVDDTVTPNASFASLSRALAFLQRKWDGPADELSLGYSYGEIVLLRDECLDLDGSKTLRLCMQGDGNLVLSRNLLPLWASGTSSSRCKTDTCRARFQGDGNLVVYDDTGSAPWSTRTGDELLAPHRATRLVLAETEPYLRIEDQSGNVFWSSTTSFSSFELKQNRLIRFAADLSLVMQGDRNLVVYRGARPGPSNEPLWGSTDVTSPCVEDCAATLQDDGNFVVHEGATPLWSTRTSYLEVHPYFASRVVLEDAEPYIQLHDEDGDVLWSSSNRFARLTIRENRVVRFGADLRLVMQGAGNLVLYRGPPSAGRVLWASSYTPSACSHGCVATVDSGVLSIRDGEVVRWSAGTPASGGWLVLSEQAPHLTLLDAAQHATWSSD